MNEQTKKIWENMTMAEKINYKNHKGMIQFIDLIRPEAKLNDAQRRELIKEQKNG